MPEYIPEWQREIAEKYAEQLDTAIERHVDLVSSGECGDCPDTDKIILSAIREVNQRNVAGLAERVKAFEELLSCVHKCIICGKPELDYEPEFCCGGQDCNCGGQPISPCLCSKECGSACYDNIGLKFDKRRKKAGIALWGCSTVTESYATGLAEENKRLKERVTEMERILKFLYGCAVPNEHTSKGSFGAIITRIENLDIPSDPADPQSGERGEEK